MNINKSQLMLYAITDRSWLNGRTLAQQVEEALIGGATIIQLREKNLEYDDFYKSALEIKTVTDKYRVPLIINDNVKIAKACNAAGVHVGQSDIAIAEARQILGPDKIIGASAHTVEEAVNACKQGADYLGVGAMFPTGTKSDTKRVSYDLLKQITAGVNIPVVAIGGITLDNIITLKGSGIAGVSVISAIFSSQNITQTTKELKNAVRCNL